MRTTVVAVLLLLVTFVVHATSRDWDEGDGRWTLSVAQSLLERGDQDLDEFPRILNDPYPYDFARAANGHVYWTYPLGTAIVAIPAVAFAERWLHPNLHRHPRLLTYWSERSFREVPSYPSLADTGALLGMHYASLLVALGVVAFFLLARQRHTLTVATIVALLLAFSTSTWSTSSRGLSQHAPATLFLTLALLCLEISARRTWVAGLAGLPLAIAYTCRPTSAIACLVFTVWVSWKRRPAAPLFALTAAVVAVPWCWTNLRAHGSLLPPYYSQTAFTGFATFPVAFLGNWISTGRGLLVFSPIYVWALLALRRRRWRPLDAPLVVAGLAHVVLVSLWACWWGGHSYGPRFMIDVLPCLSLFLCDAVAGFTGRVRGRRIASLGLFVLAAAWGCAVHYQGANNGRCREWCPEPQNVDEHPERLWSLRDPQVLAGFLR